MPLPSRAPRAARSRTTPPSVAAHATLHALNNHLGVIIGYVELLLEDLPADDPRRADLQQIQHAARAAAALLER